MSTRLQKLYLTLFFALLSLFTGRNVLAQSQLVLTAQPSNNRITLYWTPGSSNNTTFDVEKKLASSSNWNRISNVSASPWSDAAVTNGTAYNYRVKAKLGLLVLNTSNIVTVTPQDLPAPTNFVATPGNARISLAWDAVPGAASYVVWRNDPVSGWTIYGSPTSRSYVFNSLTNGIRYYFRVNAKDSAGIASPNYAYVDAVPQHLPAPSNFVAAASNAKIQLSWNAVAGATSYNIWRKTGSNPYAVLLAVSSTSYLDGSLTNGVQYSYAINAVENNGTASPNFSYADATPQLPPAPANFVAVAGNTQVQLSWSAAPEAMTFKIWRKSGTGNYVVINEVAQLNYLDSGLINGTTYYYALNAVDSRGNSSPNFSYTDATPQRPNTAPVANNDNYSTNEDTPLTIAASGVLINDTDANSDVLSAVRVSNPTKGTLTLNANGSLIYTPSANANGPDSFTYKANDGIAQSNLATVNISVIAVNDAPIANNQSISTNRNAAFNGTLTATDVDSTTLTYSKASDPTKGTVAISANGSFVYTPNAGSIGSDSFTFRASDGSLDSNAATVSITVTNRAPVANVQNISTNEDIAKAVVLSGSDADNDSLTYSVVAAPTKGILSGTAPNLTYTPNPNANGSDSFTFKANDGTIDSNIATVNITVIAVNDAPIANGQSISTSKSTAKSGTLVATDIDSATLTYSKVADPSNGTVTVASSGAFTYTPTTNYVGSDSFTFKANDGALDSNTATVNISISNTAPVASAQNNVTTNEDTAKAITLSATDVDGDALTYSITTTPTKGTLSGTAPNLTYTPNLNANGTDSFAFKANDGALDSNTATVNITITPVNDAPDAVNDTSSTPEGVAKDINVLANDTDVEGNTLTVSAVTQGTKGTTSINANNTIRYTPQSTATGSDSFTYTISDGNGATDTAIVTVTLTTATPAVTLHNLTIAPTSVVGGNGNTATGTIILSGAAPTGGIVVDLQSNNAAVQVPATATVPAGASSTQFTIATSSVSSSTAVLIKATNNSVERAATLTVTPRFEIVNVSNGDVLSGNVQVSAEIYDKSIDIESLFLKISGVEVGTFLPSVNNIWICQVQTPYIANGTNVSLTASDFRGGDQLRTVEVRNNIFNLHHDAIFDVAPEATDIPNVAHITASLTSSSNWVVKISNDSGGLVKTFNGSGSLVDVTWNGTNTAGVVQLNGSYSVSIEIQVTNSTSSSTSTQSGSNVNLSGAARQPIFKAYGSSLPPDYINFVINKNGIVDTLVLIDESAFMADSTGSTSQPALDYSRYIRTCISNKVGVTIDNQASPIIIGLGGKIGSDNSMAAQYVARINKQFSAKPLKLVYVDSHGRNNYPSGNTTNGVPRFGINSRYKWYADTPPTPPSAREVYFNVKDMVSRWNYGDSGDQNQTPSDSPKLVWISTCSSAGGDPFSAGGPHVRRMLGTGEVWNPLSDEQDWGNCFGIGLYGTSGYGGAFVGISGFGLMYQPGEAWTEYRRSLWQNLFFYSENISTASFNAVRHASQANSNNPQRARWMGNTYESF